MTTILYHDGRLFADSTIYKGSDRINSLEKIVLLNPPFKILSDRPEFEFDDIVYGYSGTGSQDAMEAFAEHLQGNIKEREDSRLTIAFYDMVSTSNMIVPGNSFEIFFIGEKANHSFRLDHQGFLYTRYELDQTVALGSGAQDVIRNITHHRDPIRAMMETFITDTTSGGWIDCWALREDDGLKRFRRVGLCEPIPTDLIRPVMEKFHADMEEIPLQFVRNAKNTQDIIRISTMNEKLFQQNKRLKKQLDILRKQGVAIPVVPTTTVKQVIAKAKAKPKTLPYTTPDGKVKTTTVKK